MRVWRNWQTRKIQVLMIARLCRFKSCYPHHSGKTPPYLSENDNVVFFYLWRVLPLFVKAGFHELFKRVIA